MKIRLESGERLVVEVPIDLATGAMVSVMANPDHNVTYAIADVVIEDGLIGNVTEHVCRRHAVGRRVEDRLALWGHLVSEHAGIFPLQATLDELIEMHEHEHNGPGTIRNHPRESRAYSLNKIGKVLSEAEPDADAAPLASAALITHEYLASYSGGREVGCHLCRKPRSEHK